LFGRIGQAVFAHDLCPLALFPIREDTEQLYFILLDLRGCTPNERRAVGKDGTTVDRTYSLRRFGLFTASKFTDCRAAAFHKFA
jgi:hypothetical protein